GQVVLDGLDADEQLGGDFPVGPADPYVVGDLPFPVGQLGGVPAPPAARGQTTAGEFFGTFGQGGRGSQDSETVRGGLKAFGGFTALPGCAEQPAVGQVEQGTVVRRVVRCNRWLGRGPVRGEGAVVRALLFGQPTA